MNDEADLHPLETHPLAGLVRGAGARSLRASSWDRTGGNRDYVTVQPNETATLLEAEGPGCITHTYCALAIPDVTDYRDAILRCYWDGSDVASVEAPLGDFFGIAHARVREFSSTLLAVNHGFGSSHGLNAYFPMPFEDGARITLEHRGDKPLGGPLEALWFQIDYELYDRPLPVGTLRFHARFSHERRTEPVGESPNETHHPGVNLDGRENYVALDTTGAGRMVGLLLEIDNIGGWYGEGDDMAFVDGQQWPPAIHGTGTEEIFGGGACPSTEYAGHYTGFHLIESPSYEGLVAMYRWYVHDAVVFERSLQWSVEHGHANNFGNRYASVAYWYQDPIVAGTPALGSADELRPRLDGAYGEARELLFSSIARAREARNFDEFRRLAQAGHTFYTGGFDQAVSDLRRALDGRHP